MRMREFVTRMSDVKLAEALRCPYEWHDELKGRAPMCDGNCRTCIRQFEYGGVNDDIRLKELMGHLTATKMARALRCPYDWFKPLEDKKPLCEYGDDCNACILQFLIGCDDSDFKPAR